jgi:hypothetical protein
MNKKNKSSKQNRGKRKQLLISDCDLLNVGSDNVFLITNTLEGDIVFWEMFQN